MIRMEIWLLRSVLFPLLHQSRSPIRAGFAVIPAWQIGISLGLLIIFAALAVWFAGRAFRLGMLRYGQRVCLARVYWAKDEG